MTLVARNTTIYGFNVIFINFQIPIKAKLKFFFFFKNLKSAASLNPFKFSKTVEGCKKIFIWTVSISSFDFCPLSLLILLLLFNSYLKTHHLSHFNSPFIGRLKS